MKIMTILGTRPEIIRLSLLIEKLDRICDHRLVHTGQNFDAALSENIFRDLRVRQPDYFLEVGSTPSAGKQIGGIISECERILETERPDKVLLLGDTNSALSAIISKRLGIPVFHVEAGNRCYDDRVPEEINRRIIDHCSDVLMPYTERSRQNLLREGIAGERIFVIGNPINEVIKHFGADIDASSILSTLQLGAKGYFLVTMHRAENVDHKDRLRSLGAALNLLHVEYGIPVIVSTHPRTRARMNEYRIDRSAEGIRFLPPFGFFDFVHLERNALCVLSDSGTVQEECCIFHVPNVTIRDVTERPETIECGSNILSGVLPANIALSVRTALDRPAHWTPPSEYMAEHVSSTAARILIGYSTNRQAAQ